MMYNLCLYYLTHQSCLLIDFTSFLFVRLSFKKSKTNAPIEEEELEPAQASTKTYHERVIEQGGIGHASKKSKAPRKSLLRGMSKRNKKDKSVKALPPSKNLKSSVQMDDNKPDDVQLNPSPVEDEAPAAEPMDEAPPAASTHSDAEDAAPMDDKQDSDEEEEQQPKEEERDEEEPQDDEPMEPAHAQTDEASAQAPPMREDPSVHEADEREQPEDQPVNPLSNYLCGCV